MFKCRYYQKDYCKFGDSCKFIHQTQNLQCIYYQKGYCKFGNNCKFIHQNTSIILPDIKEIEEVNKSPSLFDYIFSLPNDVIKSLFDSLYLSDLILVCKSVKTKIYELYPRITYSIDYISDNGTTSGHFGYITERNIEDAIYQVALRSINKECKPIRCKSSECGIQTEVFCDFCEAHLPILKNNTDIIKYTKNDHKFVLFRKKLLNDKTYDIRIKKQYEKYKIEYREQHRLQRLVGGYGPLYKYKERIELMVCNNYIKLRKNTFVILKDI